MTETKEYLKGAVERLLLDLEPKMALRSFKRKHYTNFFEQYCEKEKEIYAKLAKLFEESDNLEADMQEVAAPFVQKAEELIKMARRFSRERELMDLNCVVAFYVLPGILTIDSEHAKEFALVITNQWKEVFPNTQLTPGTYEEINSGFQRKIFGIPIE